MKHIDKYTIISILSSFLLFSCSEGLEIKSGPMILSVDKDMHMTVELTGNDAPLTEKSQTEYIELEEGTVSDFEIEKPGYSGGRGYYCLYVDWRGFDAFRRYYQKNTND